MDLRDLYRPMRSHELRACRIALDVTGAEFSRLLATNYATLSRWETGKRRIPRAVGALARLLIITYNRHALKAYSEAKP